MLPDTLASPFQQDADGTIRIAGSRIPVDTVISAFTLGSTPETICQQYPTLDLATIYAVIAFYLANRAEIEKYLERRAEIADDMRRIWAARTDQAAIRERLLARKAQNRYSKAGN